MTSVQNNSVGMVFMQNSGITSRVGNEN